MKNNDRDFENPIPNNRAVSLYGQEDALEDFPVLKAFQQYIDAEQAKSRKRLAMLGIVFGSLMLIVVSVFVVLLLGVTNRNQQLNDRLIEFAMNERNKQQSAVVVQPPVQQDTAAIVALTDRLETMRKELAESQRRADEATEAAKKAAEESTKEKIPSPESLEIERLKKLLTKEKKAAAAEREKRRQEELEAYRRKHYPEFYAPKKPMPVQKKVEPVGTDFDEEFDEDFDDDEFENDADSKIDALLDDIDLDDEGISYFNSDSALKGVKKIMPKKQEPEKPKKAAVTHRVVVSKKVSDSESEPVSKPESKPPTKAVIPEKKNSIPLDIGGSSTKWLVPND